MHALQTFKTKVSSCQAGVYIKSFDSKTTTNDTRYTDGNL